MPLVIIWSQGFFLVLAFLKIITCVGYTTLTIRGNNFLLRVLKNPWVRWYRSNLNFINDSAIWLLETQTIPNPLWEKSDKGWGRFVKHICARGSLFMLQCHSIFQKLSNKLPDVFIIFPLSSQMRYTVPFLYPTHNNWRSTEVHEKILSSSKVQIRGISKFNLVLFFQSLWVLKLKGLMGQRQFLAEGRAFPLPVSRGRQVWASHCYPGW